MNDVAILGLGLFADIVLELLDPVFTLFPVERLASGHQPSRDKGVDVLSRVKHVVKNNASTGHVHVDRQRLGLRLGLENLSVRNNASRWLVSSCQLPHEGIATIVVKVDTGNVGVVESTGTGALLVVACASAIKVGSSGATSAGARESRSLELLMMILSLEPLQEIGSGLWGKLIVSKSNTNRATSEVEPIHLFEGLSGLTSVTEPSGVGELAKLFLSRK